MGCKEPADLPAKNKPSNSPPIAEGPSTPATTREEFRSSAYQIGIALDHIATALQVTQAAKKGLKGQSLARIEDALENINGAGSRLAEYVDVIPTEDAVKADPKSFEVTRKRQINDLNDSLFELREAESIALNAADFANEPAKSHLDTAGKAIAIAEDDIIGAIEALGGKAESGGEG